MWTGQHTRVKNTIQRVYMCIYEVYTRKTPASRFDKLEEFESKNQKQFEAFLPRCRKLKNKKLRLKAV
jgi:hypothetical protein